MYLSLIRLARPGRAERPGIQRGLTLRRVTGPVAEMSIMLLNYSALEIMREPSLQMGASLVAQMVKISPANAGGVGSIPGSGRCLGEGNGNPL